MTSWGLSEEAAARLRQGWSDEYAAVSPDRDRPILSAGWKDGWAVHSAVTYAKGALVLSALEARIGRTAVGKAIATFLQRRARKPSTWDDVIAAVEHSAGSEPAAWLRRELHRVGAPSLTLAGVNAQGRRLSARLVQSADPSHEGTVEIGVLGSAGLIVVEPVRFKGPSTPITLTLPPDARRLVVDPRFRLPRRYAVEAPPERSGLEVELPPSRGTAP